MPSRVPVGTVDEIRRVDVPRVWCRRVPLLRFIVYKRQSRRTVRAPVSAVQVISCIIFPHKTNGRALDRRTHTALVSNAPVGKLLPQSTRAVEFGTVGRTTFGINSRNDSWEKRRSRSGRISQVKDSPFASAAGGSSSCRGGGPASPSELSVKDDVRRLKEGLSVVCRSVTDLPLALSSSSASTDEERKAQRDQPLHRLDNAPRSAAAASTSGGGLGSPPELSICRNPTAAL